MKYAITALAAMSAAVLTGCNNPQPIAQVPPPPPMIQPAPLQIKPVQVEDPVVAAPVVQEVQFNSAPALPTVAVESAPAPAPEGPKTYIIKKGDNLYQISKRFYGNGMRYPKILDANPKLREKYLPVGKEIIIP